MVQKEIKKSIERMCKYLEFYDKYGFFPFEKKRVDLTLAGTAIKKLQKKKNRSKYVENLILND